VPPYFKSKEQYQTILQEHVASLSSLQQLHYAFGCYAMLLIFQGMDSAGWRDSTCHVRGESAGCEVFSFKQPSAEELKHDFLWRTTCRLPQRGRIGIFNRSYNEEVLIARVHPEILDTENLPKHARTGKHLWRDRFCALVDLEKHLHRNGTRIVKFFLHLSKKEQEKRFLERIDEPDKNWKFSSADIHERKYWPQYMHAYADCWPQPARITHPGTRFLPLTRTLLA
jgi:PPK2 family polyphosphate:nucleotide phosphotransferase